MKSELLKTGLFIAGAAIITAAAAWFEPESARSEIFSDTGQTFFPEFRDISQVSTLEVVDFEESEAVARPLKVEMRKGRYLITSHSDYPAEAKDRIAKTAAALLDLKKDAAVSDRIEDHATYGVIDPLDAKNPSLTGRGKRVTLRNSGGVTLAEIVLGLPVKDKAGYRYVRLPGQKRTYAVKTDADASAHFADWVEANLLRVSAAEVNRLVLNAYQIDEQTGRQVNPQRSAMVRGESTWNAQAGSIAATMASLRVVGARPKPKQLAEQLRTKRLELTLETMMSLRQRGFFITPFGTLLSNEGELIAETAKGIVYTLRFGEVVTDATSPGGKAKDNRYLFVTVATRNPDSLQAAEALDAKFSDWYYIISGIDFARLHPARAAQIKLEREQPRPLQLPPGMVPQGMPGPPQQQIPPQPPAKQP
ncbi:MAG: DUF4340 domain-containing protein [Bryobacteraceae bacterium]